MIEVNDEKVDDTSVTKIDEEDQPGDRLDELPELTSFSPKSHTIKITIMAIFAGLGVALSSMFFFVPYFELLTVTIFIGGVILGPVYAIGLAVISASLYEIISTVILGQALIIFPFKLIAIILIALAGALLGRRTPEKPTWFWRFFIGVIGGLLTITYDLLVNVGWIFLSDFNFIAYFSALLTGLPVTASRVATNAILFFFVPDILNRAVKPMLNREKPTKKG